MKTVSIATKPLVYSTFRYINNKAWNALAEYVDNSIQSFENHREDLKRMNPGGKVCVKIQIDDNKITIEDNAWGIDELHYEKAFELANIPLDASGLNEFGMGMKVSSIWLSNYWTVETTAYGERVKKTVSFDLKEVVDQQETHLDVIEKPAPYNDHYTIVTLQQLSQNKPKQLATLKKHLASIYTKYIRDGILELIINGEVQKYEPLKILVASPVQYPDKPAIEWRQEVKFEAGKYKVNGFIGVLETMSTSADNGFLLFRRGRTIGSSGEDKYRPKELCGGVGSPQFKRIFGELELEGFDVSFTKNSFQEDEQFAQFIRDLTANLKKRINRQEIPDIFGQAERYIKPKTAAETKTKVRSFVKKLTQEIQKPVVDKEDLNAQSAINDLQPALVTATEDEYIKDVVPEFQKTKMPIIILGNEYQLELEFVSEGISTGLYSLTLDGGVYKTKINLSNPYFALMCNGEEESTRIILFIKSMVASEIHLMASGSTAGQEFRDCFNKFFGVL